MLGRQYRIHHRGRGRADELVRRRGALHAPTRSSWSRIPTCRRCATRSVCSIGSASWAPQAIASACCSIAPRSRIRFRPRRSRARSATRFSQIFLSDYKTVSTALNSGVPLATAGNSELASQFDSFARRLIDPTRSRRRRQSNAVHFRWACSAWRPSGKQHARSNSRDAAPDPGHRPRLRPARRNQPVRQQYLELRASVHKKLLNRLNLEALANADRARAEGEIRIAAGDCCSPRSRRRSASASARRSSPKSSTTSSASDRSSRCCAIRRSATSS